MVTADSCKRISKVLTRFSWSKEGHMGQEQNWTSTALHFQRSTDADCYLVAAKVRDRLSV